MDLPPGPPLDEPPASPRTVAAIDVGANSVRMVVAQVLPDGEVDILDRFQRAVRLGQDTFRRGRLGAQSMRAAVDVFRDFQQILATYRVERVRAVATSAVREAANADNFLDRLFAAARLNVEVIGTSEESRLTVSAVRAAVGDKLGVNQGHTLIADVGGGSTLLTVLVNGEILTSQSLRLGSIRLQEILATGQETPERSAELLRHQIGIVVGLAKRSLPMARIDTVVAVGGDVRFAAREIGQPTSSADLVIVPRKDFEKLVRRCERQSVEDLSKRFGLPFAEAETLTPALLVYQALLAATQAEGMIVSNITMRDGLLLDLARQVTGEVDEVLTEGGIHSATALAQKYRVDMDHARAVADLSVRLFDELKADHGLGPRPRLLLRVAGLLHEVGGFVSNLSHHKHSGYLIANSEIFGLNRLEIQVVAQVSRYHRRSPPVPSHTEYMSLPREWRVVVNKLAAILRVADALARGQIRRADDVRLARQGDELIIDIPAAENLILEQRAIAAKCDMFEDVYGMRVRLEEP